MNNLLKNVVGTIVLLGTISTQAETEENPEYLTALSSISKIGVKKVLKDLTEHFNINFAGKVVNRYETYGKFYIDDLSVIQINYVNTELFMEDFGIDLTTLILFTRKPVKNICVVILIKEH